MCTRQQCLSKLSDAAPLLRKEYGVSSLCLFGSMARGDNHAGSDVDVCVEMPPKAFKLIALKNYLQNLLGVNVDVVRRNAQMDIFLTNEIERDAVYIFS
jgi:hypothetical protein